jgi:2-keto-3-deoxy-6-phosphogluconate aldolase
MYHARNASSEYPWSTEVSSRGNTGIACDHTNCTYLAIPEVITVGGSWLATQKMIAESNWALITRTPQEALAAATA